MRHFSLSGYKVLGIGRNSTPPQALLTFGEYVCVDQIDFDKISCNVCIHASGLASDSASYVDLIKANVDQTIHLYENIDCSHFIFISSASVYPPSLVPHKETAIVDPDSLNDYGKSKRIAENFLISNTLHPTSILRPRAIYGVGDRVLLPRISRLMFGKLFILPAPLFYNVSLTCIDNLTYAIDNLLNSRPTSVEVYNIADPKTYILEDIFKSVAELLHKDVKIIRFSEKALRVAASTGISKNFNSETLYYFLNHHTLNTDKIRENVGNLPVEGFHDYSEKLENWIKNIELHQLKKQNPLLPWLGYGTNS